MTEPTIAERFSTCRVLIGFLKGLKDTLALSFEEEGLVAIDKQNDPTKFFWNRTKTLKKLIRKTLQNHYL